MIIDLNVDVDKIEITDKDFMLVRVGSDVHPASTDDIEDVRKCFEETLGKKFPGLSIIITHHAVDVCVYTCQKGQT